MIVFGSPTVGGLAGYFKKGIKNNVAHNMPARTSDFRKSFPPGRLLLEYAKITPNNAPVARPSTPPDTTLPSFCHNL